MYAELGRDPHRHVRLRLNLSMYLYLYLFLYLMPHAASFQKPFEKPIAALFRWLNNLKCPSLYDLVNLAPYRET